MKTKLVVPMVLAMAVAGWVGLKLMAADAPVDPGVKVGDKAPGFTLQDQNGKTVSLADYAGKIVVLTWINRECPYVKRHLQSNTFESLAEKYKDKGITFLGIDSTNFHDHADNLKTVAENKLTFPILGDANGMVGHAYGAKTTPEVFIVKSDGTLAYQGGIDNDPEGDKGTATVNYEDKALAELLEGKSVSISETKSYGCSVKFK